MATDLLRHILLFSVGLIDLYVWLVIGAVILSWLINFGIVNLSNPMVRGVDKLFNVLTEPVMGRIRRMMPDLGGIDISPIIVILACQFLTGLIINVLIPHLPAIAG